MIATKRCNKCKNRIASHNRSGLCRYCWRQNYYKRKPKKYKRNGLGNYSRKIRTCKICGFACRLYATFNNHKCFKAKRINR